MRTGGPRSGPRTSGPQKTRVLFRLSVELHYVDGCRYENAVRTLDEVGRLVGGWQKAHDAKFE